MVKRTRPGEKDPTTSMPVLPEAVLPRSAHPQPAEVLFRRGLPGGEQAGEPTPVAAKAGKSAVLLRPAARGPGAGVARGQSGLWARIADNGTSVTRDEAGATY